MENGCIHHFHKCIESLLRPCIDEEIALSYEVIYLVEGEDEMQSWGPWNTAKNKLTQTYGGQSYIIAPKSLSIT